MVVKDGNGSRTKHIDLRYHVLKELVTNGTLQIVYRPSVHMTSDILTKPLGPTLFLHLRNFLLGTSSPKFCELISTLT